MAENLIESLRSAGIRVPEEVSSVGDLESSVLISICAQSLALIGDAASGPSPSTSTFMASDELGVCTEMASEIKRIGYLSDITFNQFLYPSEEESNKLIRFLLERISESSEIRRNGSLKSFLDRKEDEFTSYLEVWMEKDDESGVDDNLRRIEETKLSDLSLTREASGPDESLVRGTMNGSREFGKNRKDSSDEASINERFVTYLRDRVSETRHESEKSDLGVLEEELSLLNAAVELAFDDQHSVDFHLEQLSEKVEAKRHGLQELNSQWEATRNSLEVEKKTLRKSLYANRPETQEKFKRLEDIELETQKVLNEVIKRKDELSRVTEELQRQPKGASRKSHIDRVNEITKNSRKQDTDIERILKDTRELQLESNAIQERLHRTYAIVDEMVFREAKKDPVGRQAYRLLTSIHESFEQIAEKILATDRVRREVAEREKKLTAMSSRSSNIDKLQADLEALTRENERLEKHS